MSKRNRQHPPRIAEKLLSLLLQETERRTLLGDYEELYKDLAQRRGGLIANLWYILQIVLTIPTVIWDSTKWSVIMIQNYLKIALRNMKKHKGYSIINITGLAIGMAVCFALIQYIFFELSYDKMHNNANRIYRLEMKDWAGSHGPAGLTAKEAFPEVEDFVMINTLFADGVFSREDIKFKEDRVYYATPSFLTVFSFPMISGDPETALTDVNSIVLTESTAQKYFGDEDPMGQSLIFAGARTYRITGIVADTPPNSHMAFDILVSMSTLKGDWMKQWYFSSFHTYLLIKPDTDIREFEMKYQTHISGIKEQLVKEQYYGMDYHLQPLKAIHLHSHTSFEIEENGDIKTVYFLVGITLLILFSTWINYINLCTARSLDRIKEIGLRKVFGAYRSHIMRQFLMESVYFNFIAVIIALVSVNLGLPHFQKIMGIPLSFTLWSEPAFWLGACCMFVIGIFLSGLYPSLVLSAHKPVNTLKGQSTRSSKGRLVRKGLIIFQFAISTAMIAGTITMYRQIEFMRNQDLGIGLENTLIVKAPGIFSTNSRSDRVAKMDVFKTELMKHPNISKVATSSFVPGEDVMNIHGGRRIYEPKEKAKEFHILSIDHDYLDFYENTLLAGRNFNRNHEADYDKLIINEKTLAALDFENPEQAIGEKIYFEDRLVEIIGVIKNYHQQSLKYDFMPLFITNFGSFSGHFSIKLQATDISGPIKSIQNIWEDVFPTNPFDYYFLDDYFNQQYHSDLSLGQVSGLFTVIAVIIACMGLFGLSSLNVSSRVREIGIRKTLGATIPNIIFLLYRDFLKLIGIAVITALPASYFFYKNWLTNYAFRTTIGWWFAGLPIAMIILVAVGTILYQVIRSAFANPVDTFRYE